MAATRKQHEDIPLILKRIEEEVAASPIQKPIVLDTAHASVDETFAEFVLKLEPPLSNVDVLRCEQLRAGKM